MTVWNKQKADEAKADTAIKTIKTTSKCLKMLMQCKEQDQIIAEQLPEKLGLMMNL